MNRILKDSIVNAAATTIYILAVALFMNYGSQTRIGANYTLLMPIGLLLLFVFSAAYTGFFVFGRAALLYIDGKKQDALKMVMYTLGILSAITFVCLFLIIYFSS